MTARSLGGACLAAAFAFSGSWGAASAATLQIAGSTTLLPLVREAAQAYEAAHGDMLLIVTGGGSKAALTQLAGHEIDIAATDTFTGGTSDLVDHRIAVIVFAVAINPKAGVTTLDIKQLRDIFSGKVTNWKELGGNDVPVVAINRPESSGLRALFTDRIMDTVPYSATAPQDEATTTLVADLQATPGAIGYAAVSSLRDSGLSTVAINGITPTDSNVEDGLYPLWAYEHMITNGSPSPDISRFLAYLETNSTLLHENGYILVRDMKVRDPAL